MAWGAIREISLIDDAGRHGNVDEMCRYRRHIVNLMMMRPTDLDCLAPLAYRPPMLGMPPPIPIDCIIWAICAMSGIPPPPPPPGGYQAYPPQGYPSQYQQPGYAQYGQPPPQQPQQWGATAGGFNWWDTSENE